MPPSTLNQASGAAQEAAAEQAAAGRAAALRRRAREIAEAEEVRRLYRWWRDPIVWVYGAAPFGAVAPGVVLMLAGEPLGPTLAAIGVGMIVGFVALFVSTLFGEPFADNRLLFPLFVIVIPGVTAAAGTLVVAGYIR